MEKAGFEMEKAGLSPAPVCAMLLWSQMAVGITAPSFTSCMTMGMKLYLSELQFLCLQN